jgi:formate/nitrite transporter FocA (FNT family)
MARAERQQVERRTSPSAAVVHEAIRREGEDELRRPSSALAWSGLAAGLSMGFSLVAEGLIREGVPEASWRPLLVKLGYAVGFLIVVLGRQQLFTENTLTPILPLLHRRNLATLVQVLRLWAVVLAANLAGALLFALALVHTGAFTPEARKAFATIGQEAASGDFWTTFVRAIFAGWLIALMVWLLPFAETGRIAVIVLITYLVGLAGFAHSIAGSIEVLYSVLAHERSWAAFLGGFLLPTLFGNIVGGVALVAAINHAQVVAGSGQDV